MVAPAASAHRDTIVEGPFGQGADAVWLLRPAGQVQHIVVFGHGWKLFPPSATHPWVGQFQPWLDHLVAEGNAVIFPRYQLGTGDDGGRPRIDSYRRGLEAGFRRLHVRHLPPAVVVGYSYGASLAFYYAANARSWGLPIPVALDGIFPAGLIPGGALPRMPASVRVLIQVGDRDTEAGTGGANAFWQWLSTHPSTRKRYDVVRSTSTFAATHAAPKETSASARRAFWQPLDALLGHA